MPRLKNRLPSYRSHRGSGQAVVTLYGLDYYLGLYGTAASRREYDRLTGEWQAGNSPAGIRPAGPLLLWRHQASARGRGGVLGILLSDQPSTQWL